MDFLYRILITHNRPWSVREIIFFSIFFLILAGILLRQLRCKKLSRVQFFGWIVLYVFLSTVFASTVFTRTPEERHYKLETCVGHRSCNFHCYRVEPINFLPGLVLVGRSDSQYTRVCDWVFGGALAFGGENAKKGIG